MPVKIDVTVASRSAAPEALIGSHVPQVVPGNASHLVDLATRTSIQADRCIYCGSTDRLSDEHVIPYAWGGTLQILRGSCEPCRLITSAFENFALNDGEMPNIRKQRGLASRSNHKSATPLVEVTFVKDGREIVELLPIESVPLLLGFPWLSKPALLSGLDDFHVRAEGWITTSVGPDSEQFLRDHGATGARLKESAKRPVALARTLAKIAYASAWLEGALSDVDDSEALVNTFMHNPDDLGAFVGMKSAPFERFAGVGFRTTYRPDELGLLCMEVQPFPDIPAPTYLVVLGGLANLRAWRRIRAKLSRRKGSPADEIPIELGRFAANWRPTSFPDNLQLPSSPPS